MGDRAQVCIKDGSGKVYLYGHNSGVSIYAAAAAAIRDVPGRLEDSEYFARAVFCRMIPVDSYLDETGFGIGTNIHSDVEHAVPVFDCDTQTVTWDQPEWTHNKKTIPGDCSFAEFVAAQTMGKYDNL